MSEFDLATLHEAIADTLRDQPCIIADRTYTWRETTERTRRLAAVLRAHGIGRRRPCHHPWQTGQDHVGVYLHNGPEYLETILGAHKASAVPFNVNYRYTGEELAYLLHDANPAALVYGAHFAPVLAETLPLLDRHPLLIQVGGTELFDDAIDYETALAEADPNHGIPDASPQDRHLLYTGGTTGMPKGVIWRMGDLVGGPLGVRNAQTVEDVVARARRTRGRVLPAPPLMHGAGTGFALGGWLGGATVVIPPHPERFDAATLLDTCERHAVTSLAIVGDAFAAPLVAEFDTCPRNLTHLRLLVNSGAILGEVWKDRLRERLPGLRITDVLGASETGLHAKRHGKSFTARGETTVIDDARTRLARPGEPGWMAQGGHIPIGYLGDPQKTAVTFVTIGGRRLSVPGDRAKLLEDGTFEFLGREATTINTGGEKVFAEEVEQVLRAVPGVTDAVVVGRASPRWGQEVVGLYHGEVAADGLAAECRKHLAGYKVPKDFIRVEAVVRHANGKPDYAWARAAAVKETR